MADTTVTGLPLAGGTQLRLRGAKGTFALQTEPLPDKLERDGQRAKEFARWVLIIDRTGAILRMIENKNYIANIIAVLGPTESFGMSLPETVLLEIGISKGRPYTQAESHRRGGRQNRDYMKERRRGPRITFDQLKSVWSTILTIVEEVIVEERASWENKGPWPVATFAGWKYYERGITFTLSRGDPVLLEAFFAREVEVRGYLRTRARHIAVFLRQYKYVYYPKKQLKSLAGVKKVVELWSNMTNPTESRRWSPRYARKVLGFLPASKRELFQHIAEVHGLDLGGDVWPDAQVQQHSKELVFPKHLHVRFEREGEKEGRGCSIFEVFFEKEYREKMGY